MSNIESFQFSATVRTGEVNYKTVVKSGSHTLISDEPESVGGGNEGPDPFALLLSSLGSCMAITLRMYADRKQWDLQEVEINLYLTTTRENNEQKTFIRNELWLKGSLSDEQKNRLHYIAAKCPIHKVLKEEIFIDTEVR